MKNHLLTVLFSVCSLMVRAQNPIPHPGFETWLNGNPDGWGTNNLPGVGYPITQGAPFTGMYSARGEVITGTNGVMAPYIRHAIFPYNTNYSTMSFYYKFHQVGAGSFDASVSVFDANSIINPIAYGSKSFRPAANSWTQVNIPIIYTGVSALFCQMVCTITDTLNPMPDVGNYFLIDDFSLSGFVDVDEHFDDKAIAVSDIQPNPVSDFAYLYYSLLKPGDIRIDIYDIGGRVCKSIEVAMETAGKHKIELDATEIPAGFYIIKMSSSNGSSTAKLQVVK